MVRHPMDHSYFACCLEAAPTSSLTSPHSNRAENSGSNHNSINADSSHERTFQRLVVVVLLVLVLVLVLVVLVVVVLVVVVLVVVVVAVVVAVVVVVVVVVVLLLFSPTPTLRLARLVHSEPAKWALMWGVLFSCGRAEAVDAKQKQLQLSFACQNCRQYL